PGLRKDGVEAHLQELLAAQPGVLGDGWRLVGREDPTAIGPVDLMCRDADRAHVAVEIKRRGDIDGVEQLTRYLDLLNRDPLLAPVRGIFAAQEIKPQARVLAEDRGIRCVTLDYESMRGTDDGALRLFSAGWEHARASCATRLARRPALGCDFSHLAGLAPPLSRRGECDIERAATGSTPRESVRTWRSGGTADRFSPPSLRIPIVIADFSGRIVHL